MQVRTVNGNSRSYVCHYSLFSEKNPIIRIFCISGWLAVLINPDLWSSAVYVYIHTRVQESPVDIQTLTYGTLSATA